MSWPRATHAIVVRSILVASARIRASSKLMKVDLGLVACPEDAKGLSELQRELTSCADLAQARVLLATHLSALLPVKDRVSIVFLEPDGEWLRIYRVLPAAS